MKSFYGFNFVLFALLFFFSNLFSGTTGKITGIVKDASTGEPLPGVNVLVEGTPLGAATDLDGYYVILNVPPGSYVVKANMIGYTEERVVDVNVRIDQTTTLNFTLKEETLEISEAITVVAKRPIVEPDVAGSRANLSSEEIENIPVVNITSVVGLQAGVQGLNIRSRGSKPGRYYQDNSDQVAFVVNGITLRDGRDNTPFTGVSLTAVEEMQIQAGGFSAEFGNVRSGIINVVTKEGSRRKYTVSFLGTYSPIGAKHFGHSPNSPESYWIKPLVDDAVAWTGTKNGAWDKYTQAQYREWKGWNVISEETLQNSDPNDDLTPEAAQRLFLFQHRRQLDIQIPDYLVDVSFGGPVPFISEKLGGLRFFTSFRKNQNAYLIPLHDNALRDYSWQIKVTSDVGQGKKLMLDWIMGDQRGVDRWNSGIPGVFTASWQIASALSNGPKYIDARMFSTDYWGPSIKDFYNIGLKWTHAISQRTFYEASFYVSHSQYDKNPGRPRDRTLRYKFGNNYWVDESPFGFEWYSTSGIDGMRMGAGMSNARDSSKSTTYSAKVAYVSQLNRINNLKIGGEFELIHSQTNYGRYDQFLPDGNRQSKWDRKPIRAAFYVEDKLEFEGMIASVGLRIDYSHAGGDWYVYDPYTPYFSNTYAKGIDTLLQKEPTKHIVTFSPRVAIAFPVTENSKIYFNYGHFRQLPLPDDLYMIRYKESGELIQIGDPNAELQRTIAYELGFEQNLWNQVLLRAAGYYKDVSLQPKLVTYENFDGSVRYSKSEPNNYEDIRGLEITLNKNRGEWVRGFINYTYQVSTYGYFGYGRYYENPATQRQYEKQTTYYYQAKPKPRPYGRLNLLLFTPPEYGPQWIGQHFLGDWRLNILGSWTAGRYETWVGGSSIPGIFSNVQWPDTWNFDIRISKNFKIGKSANIELFVDLKNVFNFKYLTPYGFVDWNDRYQYYTSLHLPANTAGIDQFGYYNIPGDDQPGDYRRPGVDFVPIVIVNSLADVEDLNPNYLYYVKDTGQQYWYNEDNQSFYQDAARTQKVYDEKAYIDMPNLQYLTFLNPRDIFWGLRFSFEF